MSKENFEGKVDLKDVITRVYGQEYVEELIETRPEGTTEAEVYGCMIALAADNLQQIAIILHSIPHLNEATGYEGKLCLAFAFLELFLESYIKTNIPEKGKMVKLEANMAWEHLAEQADKN